MQWFLCVTLLVFVTFCGAVKNVLILDSVGSPSHNIYMQRLSRALAERSDYNVTTLTYATVKDSPENLHAITMADPYFGTEIDFLAMSTMTPWDKFRFTTEYSAETDKVFMESEYLKLLMDYPKEFKFDLIIFDYLGPMAVLVLADRYPSAKVIATCALPTIEFSDRLTHAPYYPAFIPNALMDEVGESFLERLESFLLYMYNHYHWWKYYPELDQMINRHYKVHRKIQEIQSTIALILPNWHPLMGDVTPTLPSVIPVGGLQIEPPQALPADLEEIYAAAEKGVILFSLGTNVKSEFLGMDKLKAIANALSEFPEYHVIWKIDLSKVELELPKNVFVRSWLPQNDILGDPRTKLFISHAGGLSTLEASWYGVPMLAIPVMFDQFPVR